MWETLLDPDEASARVARAERVLASTLGGSSDEELADEGRARRQLALALALADRCDDALPHATRAHSIWVRLGRARATLLARIQIAELDARLGALERACGALAATLDDPLCAPYEDTVHILRARIAAQRADPARVEFHMARALDVRAARGSQAPLARARALAAELLSLARDAQENTP